MATIPELFSGGLEKNSILIFEAHSQSLVARSMPYFGAAAFMREILASSTAGAGQSLIVG